MSVSDLSSYLSQAMYLVLWLSLPPIIAASVIGVLFALFQALTQIQEQTLSFGVKLVTVMIAMAMTGRWMSGEIFNFTVAVFEALPLLGK